MYKKKATVILSFINKRSGTLTEGLVKGPVVERNLWVQCFRQRKKFRFFEKNNVISVLRILMKLILGWKWPYMGENVPVLGVSIHKRRESWGE